MKNTKNLVLTGTSVLSAFSLVLSLHFYSDNQSLRSNYHKLNQKQEKLIQDFKGVESKNEEIRKDNHKLQHSLSKANKSIKATSNKNKELEKKNLNLNDQVDKLKNKLASIKKNEAAAAERNRGHLLKVSNPTGDWIMVQASYYVATCSGCIGKTRTGHDVRSTIYENGHRIIAVDPNLIPLGSLVEVRTPTETFTAIASDTGNKIKGNKIDVLVSNRSIALSKGVNQAKVRIIH